MLEIVKREAISGHGCPLVFCGPLGLPTNAGGWSAWVRLRVQMRLLLGVAARSRTEVRSLRASDLRDLQARDAGGRLLIGPS